MLTPLRFFTVLLGALATAGASYLILSAPVPPAPRLGYRGQERRRAMELGGAFALAEPLVRLIAGLVALLPLQKQRAAQELELRRADYPLGITADEYGALAVLSAAALTGVSVALSLWQGIPWTLAIPALGLGLALPRLQVQEIIRTRAKEITRAFPSAIEICAMCMSAGLDFPGALRLIAGPKSRGALAREFSVIVEELELGHTRREALEHFALRVPTDAVRDFVAAVVQAEQKGNPLAQTIQIQGRLLSQRRSVAAEEAAARAGVLMMGPMVLMLGAILILLLGPFMTKGFQL